MKVGLIGNRGAGKTTIFNMLTGLAAQVGGFGGKEEIHLGMIKVPDVRIDKLAQIYRPKKTTYAEIRFTDFPPGQGEEDLKSNNALLAHMREVDAITLVLRDFGVNAQPLKELNALLTEMILADLTVVKRGLRPQLPHVPEHGDSPALGRKRRHVVQRGANRDRVGVVGVVDQDRVPPQWDDLAAERGEQYPRRPGGHLLQRHPQRDPDRDRRQRVGEVVGLGEGELELLLARGRENKKQAEAAWHLLMSMAGKAEEPSFPVLALCNLFLDDTRPRVEAETIVHRAQRADHAGCVDLWPLEREEKAEQREAWDAPLDVEGEGSANKRLAARIADEIAALIARGDAVYDKELRDWRPASAGASSAGNAAPP